MLQGLGGRSSALLGLAWLVLGPSPQALGAALSPPGGVSAMAPHGHQVDLAWAGAEGALGYRVARACADGDAEGYCELAELPGDSRSYRDVSVRSATQYQYRVEAFSGSTSATAVIVAKTPSLVSLPLADPPIYPEPQGAWNLGARLSLEEIKRLHVRHNLASARDLRILLDASNSHSLVSRLGAAGYSVRSDKPYDGEPEPGVAEIYFYDLKRGSPEGPLPPAIEAFDRMGDEGYVLVAEAAGDNSLRIVVGAQTPKGLFRGGMTVERLLLDDRLTGRRQFLEPLVVLDYPDHPFRGSSPSWAPMNANYQFVPERALDMLDALARAGATTVDWMASGPAQESHHWETTGAQSAARVQMAAAERFMEVSYFMGAASVGHGTKGPPEVAEPQASMDQVPFADGLGVVAEPFSWIETQPGRWQAFAERQGALHGRNPDELGRPWEPGRCESGVWKHDRREDRPGSGPGSWRLAGGALDCDLMQPLDVKAAFAPGRYFLAGWVKISRDAAALSGKLSFEIDTEQGTQAFAVSFPDRLAADRWTEISLAIPDLDFGSPVSAARLVVRGSLTRGSVWLDDVTLHEWSGEIFRFGSFAEPAGWRVGSAPGAFEFDASQGRRDSKSIRIATPLVLGEGEAARLAGRVDDLRLEEGRYVLGAWLKGAADPPTGIGDPGDYLETNLDISLRFFDQPARDGRSQGRQVEVHYLNFPARITLKPAGWVYRMQIFDVSAETAARARSSALQIRVFDQANPGTLWIDDVHLRRLDGDLRNLLGAIQPPRLQSVSGRRYSEGKDYRVCQVGRSETECTPPSNYLRLLEGGLTSTYNEDRPPFEIHWIGDEAPTEKRLKVSYDIGAQYSAAGKPQTSWDGQTITPSALNFCAIDAVSRGIGLETILGRYLDGYTLEDFPSRGENYIFKANDVTWGVSEVRGINRSIACLDELGQPVRSNAVLFAGVVNEVLAIARKKNPAVRFWLWDDMLNPFNNGGDADYQVKYGGVAGRSACAVAPASIESLCADEVAKVADPIVGDPKSWDGAIVMQPWSYLPTRLRAMVAISGWYQDLGVASQVLPGADSVNVEDWAAIAKSFDGIRGVVGTIYQAHKYGGRTGLLPALQKFWNHDWKLLYLYDAETAISSHYQVAWPFVPKIELKGARLDDAGACAIGVRKFSGNNDGGICLASSPAKPKILLTGVPVREGASYRVDVLARQKARGNSAQPPEPPRVSIRWSSGDALAPVTATLIYDSQKFRDSEGFDRYRVEIAAPGGAGGMDVEIEFGTGGGIDAVDDVAVFESTPRCFNACAERAP